MNAHAHVSLATPTQEINLNGHGRRVAVAGSYSPDIATSWQHYPEVIFCAIIIALMMVTEE